jgi:hypothetical protein
MRWTIGDKEFWAFDSKYKIKWDKKAPSKGSQIVKDFLEENFKNHILYEEYRLPKKRLKVDFLSATGRWAIEFHGKQHNSYVKHFHGDKLGFLGSIKRDMEKYNFLKKTGFVVIELYDEDLKDLTYDYFINKVNEERTK